MYADSCRDGLFTKSLFLVFFIFNPLGMYNPFNTMSFERVSKALNEKKYKSSSLDNSMYVVS